MKIVKPLQLGLMSRTFVKDKRYYLSVAALSYFPFHNSTALGTEQEMWQAIFNTLDEDMVFDLCMPKPSSEVLMVGNCFAPKNEPTEQLYVDIHIGDILKRLVVTGNRFWKRGIMSKGMLGHLVDNDWEMTQPEPFATMDIGWKNAFGGKGFASNPNGKGYIPNGEIPFADETSPLPNVERIDSTVVHPKYEVMPGGYGPIDMSWPMRANKLGKKYDKKWEKNRYPEPAEDMVSSYYNCAPPDQVLKDSFWNGDEEFVITNMHPKQSVLKSNIPKIRPRCFILQKENEKERWNEVSLTPETIWLFPNSKRGILISRGVYEVDTFYGVDVDTLLLAWELQNGRTRSVDDYRNSVRLRQDDETSIDWLARQDDLSPPEGIPEEESIFFDEHTGSLGEKLAPLIENIEKEANAEIEQLKKIALHQGANPAHVAEFQNVPKITLPAVPQLNKMSDIPKLLEFAKEEEQKLMSDMAQMKKGAIFAADSKEEAQRKILAKSKEIYKEMGLDEKKLLSHPNVKPPSDETPLKKLAKLLTDGKEKIADLPGQEDKIEKLDMALGELKKAEKKLDDVNAEINLDGIVRAGAHYEDKPEPLPPNKQQERRKWVKAQYDMGHCFENEDLKGVDLSGMSLPKINFRKAKLDGANLSNADLTGADVSQASLAHATCQSATFTDANFENSNMGKANFHKANLCNATLVDITLEETNFSEATLNHTNIKADNGLKCDFSHADISDSNFNETDFMECRFESSNLQRCKLAVSTFMDCDFSNTNFSNANLTETSMIAVTAQNARFCDATLCDFNVHEDSNFTGSIFTGIDGTGMNCSNTNLSKANFENAQLKEASFGESTLTDASMNQALAREADFTDADLCRATLVCTDLMNASFQGAILTETNFTNAHVFGADFMFAQKRDIITDGTAMKRSNLKD